MPQTTAAPPAIHPIEQYGLDLRGATGHGPTIERVAAQGDVVVVIAHETGRYADSHERYDHHFVQEFTFRDGRMFDYRLFVCS